MQDSSSLTELGMFKNLVISKNELIHYWKVIGDVNRFTAFLTATAKTPYILLDM